MALELEPWEPEESVGKVWHALTLSLVGAESYPDAAVRHEEVRGRLQVLFHGLGGAGDVEMVAAAPEESAHRRGALSRLATPFERLPQPSFDGARLRLPEQIDLFPSREANAALYLWLAAVSAHSKPYPLPEDPLRADIEALEAAQTMVRRTLLNAPGYRALYRDLCAAVLAVRPQAKLPPVEAAVEARVRVLLGADDSVTALPDTAPPGYLRSRPVVLWPELRGLAASAPLAGDVEEGGASGAQDERGAKKARRRDSDQVNRRDSFILHKFEAILSWAEYLNLNRRVEDDDEDSARKAADDTEELGLGQVDQKTATRLKLHLDLSPQEADRERLAAKITYPEWDAATGSYLPDHVRVLVSPAEPVPLPPPDAARARRIAAVRRQFEALRPGRVSTPGHREGEELDLDRALRSQIDLAVTGQGDDRIWRQSRPEARSLAVTLLLDCSRSTESSLPGGRQVIDVAREAVTALAWGLAACGDDLEILGFSSLRRDRVFVSEVKHFGEEMGASIEARIAGLSPGHYTRLGAAIRHASAGLAAQERKRRLLLVITDGKPNDLDHYEGRHGIEDSRKAVGEARMRGQAVFGITLDAKAQAWFPRIFGTGGFALVPQAERLTAALPVIYRQLVGG